jgi:integrase
LYFVQDVNAELLRSFQGHLRTNRRCSAATANHYLDAVHNFFGYAIFKRKLMAGPNPAATGRQAELDRLPHQVLAPPTIYPDQINAVIEVAARHFDSQIINIIVFVCEGGFRFQELQFLQVGDINLEEREIILDIKKPNLERTGGGGNRTPVPLRIGEGLYVHSRMFVSRLCRRQATGCGIVQPG